MTALPSTAGTRDVVADLGAGRGPVWLDAALERRLPQLIAVRRRIHAHPELGYRERDTTALVADTLAEAGITGTVLRCGTGLVAEIGAGGPVVALRADLDALPLTEETALPYASAVPGVAHACGHDLHTTVVLGAALTLAAAPQLSGRVRLIFQPAEEQMPGGAGDVVAAGALDDVDVAYAVHCDPQLPVGQIGTRVGPITSTCDMVDIEVTGPGGHTSRPHLTVDVIGALATVATQLPHLLARHLPTGAGLTLVWGAIEGGGAHNVIPQRGVLRGTVRLSDRAAWDQAPGLVRRLVAQILAPFDANHEVRYAPGVPPVINDARAVALLRRGIAVGLGAAALVEVGQSSGAEDFAVLLDEVPGALARLGVWDGTGDRVDLHSATFRADERAIAVGVRALAHAALAVLAQGESAGITPGSRHTR